MVVLTLDPAGVIICVDIRQHVVCIDEEQSHFSPASRDGRQWSANFGSGGDYNTFLGDPTLPRVEDSLKNRVVDSLVEDVNLSVF